MRAINPSQEIHSPTILRVFQSKAETRAFYNKIAKVYDLMAERSEEPVRQEGLAMLDAQPGESVLEIGFGTGHCLISLARSVGPTGKVYGLDLSDTMLEVARANLLKEGLATQVELTSGDAVHLPYPSECLDAVFMSFTLELFDTDEIPLVLTECQRVLRPKGRMVVVAMSKVGEEGVIMHIFEWTHQHFPNLLDCRPIFLQMALEEAHFRTVRAARRNMWVPVEIVLGMKTEGSDADGASA